MESINCVFVGHVDSGKSTLSGHMMYLSGCVDERYMEKCRKEAKENNRESWKFAYLTDIHEKERQSGKTCETASVYFETKTKKIHILDAPGHKYFVPSMIDGANQADVAFLVISARKGEFEAGFEKGGQTKEHAIILKTCGVKYVVVVVNKMDDKTVKYSEKRYNDISRDLSLFMHKIGYKKEQFEFIPVSAFSGEGIKDPMKYWWKGKSLYQCLDDLVISCKNKDSDILRFPIYGCLEDAGKLYLKGKLESGIIREGDEILILPSRDKTKVENIDKNVVCVKPMNISTGDVITNVDSTLRVCTEFTANVLFLDIKNIITEGFSCIMHIHSSQVLVTFSEILTKNLKFIKNGQNALISIKTDRPICVETHETFDRMSRCLFRDDTSTFGMGIIIEII